MTELVTVETPARCHWCNGPFLLDDASIAWCTSPRCRARQESYAIGAQTPTGWKWLYVPLPKQVDFEACRAKYRLYGGAAGGAKSHGARWALYKYALLVPGFEALILRKTFPELEKTHLRRMAREAAMFNKLGIPCEYRKGDRQIYFPQTGSLIEAGHMDDADAVERYLSTEYDGIAVDEGSRCAADAILELSTRTARVVKPALREHAGGSFFWVLTNPGGPATVMLRDFFIDHTPDFSKRPELAKRYQPAQWVYIESKIEDNPYLDPDYESTLAVLSATRYEQLRHANWRIFAGQFFDHWRDAKDGQPWHVAPLEFDPRDVQWFRALDWGRSSPGCLGWIAVLPNDHYHVAYEKKFQGQSPAQVQASGAELEREHGITHVLYTAGDPALHMKSQSTGVSIADEFAAAGWPIRRRISNDRINGWNRFRSNLEEDPGTHTPYWTFAPECPYLRRTIPDQQQAPHDPEDIDTTGDDHGADMVRYGMMSRPPRFRPKELERPAGAIGDEIDKIREDAQNDPQRGFVETR